MATTAKTAPEFSTYAYGSTEARTGRYTILASLFSWTIFDSATYIEIASGEAPASAHADLARMQAEALAAYAAI